MACPDTAVAAKKTVEVGKRQILDQRFRIQRQHELIARHERGGILIWLLMQFGHLAEATVDESSLAEVERETPM
jgi:hypothetical protein